MTRLFATVLAALALGGQLASFAHLALVRHVTCEHGELVEIGPSHQRAALPVRESAPAVDADSDRHGHDHCLLAPMRRDRLALGAPSAFDSSRVDTVATIGRAADRTAIPPIAVLRLAPKSSPPRV